MEQITLDLIPNGSLPVLHASQYDDGRQWKVNLTENGEDYTLSNETIVLDVRKGDGCAVTCAVAIESGKKYVILTSTEQMCAVAGQNLGELKITKDNTEIGTLNFILQVERDPLDGGRRSGSEIHDLQAQVDECVTRELETVGAKLTGYDNTESGLEATNVQDAIDELASQPSVDAYTKEETNALLEDKANSTDVYNKTYIDTALSAKANANAVYTKSEVDDLVGGLIDDESTADDKTWSSEKIDETVTTVYDNIDAIEDTVDGISEGGASKNLYPTNLLKNATGISYNNGVFSGLANAFMGAPTLENVFKENTRYTAQITTRLVSGSVTTGNGLIIRFLYSDGTYMSTYIPNGTNSFTKFTLTSDEGKEVVGFKFTYASGGTTNTWEVKEVQVEEGTEATSWVSPDSSTLTALDRTARASIEKINALPWFSRFQREFLKIAYSAIWVDKINTATHWLFASDMGFNVLKGDVEITSDGELIMCHDPGFTFDENGRIINYNSSNKTLIVEMTYAECRSKVYAENPARYGNYCPVADIDDFIKICKDKGKICFVTVRSTNTAAVVSKLVEKIRYYSMESATIINATSSSIIDVVRANADTSGIAVNFVAPEGQAITNDHVDMCLAWGNAFLSIWADGSTTVIDNSATAITYAKEKGVPLLAAVNGEMSFWNYLIKKGIMGYQITKPIFDVEPKSQRFAVKMTSGTPTFENLFASNRFTGTVTLSGSKIYVNDIYITDSYLTDVIDGIQPIKMNMLNPEIRCFDSSGNSVPCVWSSTSNRFEITIPDSSDNTYRVLVTV